MQSRNSQNILGLDVSHHNGKVNWKQVTAAGYKFVYLKLTEDKSYVDKTTYDNYIAAKNAGLRVGFYHYAHCTNDPMAEVNFFLNMLGKMKADLPHCLDLEENKGQSKSKVTAFAIAWMEYMQKKTGITPILYTGWSFSKSNFTSALAKYPLWVARYSGSNRVKGFANPGDSAIWDKWSMFQFTDQGKVSGIKGNVDINEMDLTFFKSIDTGVTVIGDTKPPSQIQFGDSGLATKELQQNIMKLGFKLPKSGADGAYGYETVAAIKAFQKKYNLIVDGIAGEQTLAKVAELLAKNTKPQTPQKVTKKYPLPSGVLKKGDKGDSVRQLQEALVAVDFYPNKRAESKGVDGIFGEQTEDAVSRFQSVYLSNAVDGIYGSNTKSKLQAVLKSKGI